VPAIQVVEVIAQWSDNVRTAPAQRGLVPATTPVPGDGRCGHDC